MQSQMEVFLFISGFHYIKEFFKLLWVANSQWSVFCRYSLISTIENYKNEKHLPNKE